MDVFVHCRENGCSAAALLLVSLKQKLTPPVDYLGEMFWFPYS